MTEMKNVDAFALMQAIILAQSEQEELDAVERPVAQAKAEEDIYECEHCNAEFGESEILRRDFGGETGGITFCPRCKQATKLICVTEASQ